VRSIRRIVAARAQTLARDDVTLNCTIGRLRDTQLPRATSYRLHGRVTSPFRPGLSLAVRASSLTRRCFNGAGQDRLRALYDAVDCNAAVTREQLLQGHTVLAIGSPTNA
jgi:hypothetical protein